MLSDISLHVLDIAQNSIQAGADLIHIAIQIKTREKRMVLEICDNGCGMSSEKLLRVTDPFFTSRTTRKVGLGVPFLKQSAECTGGTFFITSKEGQGTKQKAVYNMGHMDCIPLGDITQTIHMLVLMNTKINFVFSYWVDLRKFVFDTREIKDMLGDVPMDSHEVSSFIKEYLQENIAQADNSNGC